MLNTSGSIRDGGAPQITSFYIRCVSPNLVHVHIPTDLEIVALLYDHIPSSASWIKFDSIRFNSIQFGYSIGKNVSPTS